MTLSRRLFTSTTAALVCGCISLRPSGAEEPTTSYPSRPITIIVPFAAGGPNDVVARITAEHMRLSLGQPLIVENVAGAGGSTGVGRAVRAAADGYTLSIGSVSTHVLNGAIYPLSFDSLSDFEPVAMIASSPLLIVAKKTMLATDFKELIAWLKANPDRATQAMFGAGNLSHIAGLHLQQTSGTRFAFVPYRGSGPAMQDLLAGQIDFMFDFAASATPQIRSGTIKAYAVTAKTRLGATPDVPTVDEAGLPGFHVSSWNAYWVPKGTPKAIIDKLNQAVVNALADPTVRQKLADLEQEIPPREQQTPEALDILQKDEKAKWWPIIKEANIKP
jgi:tripartite-type tricarboxylate transporter receptor subunit TctC